MPETAICGWANIAKFFGVSTRTMMRRKKELQECGAIFYVLKDKAKRKVVCAFPSVLKVWISLKNAKYGERFWPCVSTSQRYCSKALSSGNSGHKMLCELEVPIRAISFLLQFW